MRFSPSVFLPPTRSGGCGVTPSLSNYDQAYGRPARPGAPVHASAPPFFICERWLAVRRSWRGMSYAFSSPRGIIIFHSLTQQSSRRRRDGSGIGIGALVAKIQTRTCCHEGLPCHRAILADFISIRVVDVRCGGCDDRRWWKWCSKRR